MNENDELSMQALTTVSNIVCVVDRKFAKKYKDLVEPLAGVPIRLFNSKDEDRLDDALTELNAMAESEPRFFKSKFKELMEVFIQIVEC